MVQHSGRQAEFVFAVATASLGQNPVHTLESKFKALQQAGFTQTTLGAADFFGWIRQKHPDAPQSTAPAEWSEGGEPDPSDDELWILIHTACGEVTALAADFGLKIVGFQPLNQFEGWQAGKPRAAWARQKATRWLRMCSDLGIDLLQVGSNNMPDCGDTSDLTKYIEDMRWLADLGASQPSPVRISYESWCFAVHVNTWEWCWEVVRRADHPNLGLCLDVAHFPLSPDYGFDPATGVGFTDAQFSDLVARLRKVPADKIFYVEVSDVSAPSPPLHNGNWIDPWVKANQPQPRGDRGIWCSCARPLPYVGRNAGALQDDTVAPAARVDESLKAIFDTGFKGLIVFEFFEAPFMDVADETVPARYASACAKAEPHIRALLD